MSAKAISEQTGKEYLYKYICTSTPVQNRFCYANVTAETDFQRLTQDHPWLLTERLVVKPDQLIKRRGKLGLVGVNLDLNGVKEWLKPRLMKETMVRHALFLPFLRELTILDPLHLNVLLKTHRSVLNQSSQLR
ncbi:hypothetical protein GOODEAATRI_004300 [Goodea atripinnis]|uniref:ATP-citrate synthase ATP-grasp domain-containing protein n=1 Tax=Goodea atripinnis TaxID=208336 RepID=A0ABV0P1E7_9TELE